MMMNASEGSTTTTTSSESWVACGVVISESMEVIHISDDRG